MPAPRHFFLQRLPVDDAAQLAPALTPARGGARRASALREPGRRRGAHRAARRTCQQRRPPRLAAKEKPPWLRCRRWQPGARAALRPAARCRWPGTGELDFFREAQEGRVTMDRPRNGCVFWRFPDCYRRAWFDHTRGNKGALSFETDFREGVLPILVNHRARRGLATKTKLWGGLSERVVSWRHKLPAASTAYRTSKQARGRLTPPMPDTHFGRGTSRGRRIGWMAGAMAPEGAGCLRREG